MKISEYLILVKSFELLRGNFIWIWVGEHTSPVWCFWESIMAIFKEIECFPSNQGKQSKRDWTLYPISANIRKPTIISTFWITFTAIQRTYRLVRNGKIIIISATIVNNVKTCFFILLPSSLVITLLYQGNNQIYQNRKSEISIRKNIKYAIFYNKLIFVL